MLTGTPVQVKYMTARFTTDAEFRRYLRNIFYFSVKRGLAMLTEFFAPYLKALFNLKFVDDKTTNYIRNAVRSAVEYR